jgi:hypothetical protein
VSYTKVQLVKGALAEIGLSDYAFELSTDQIDQGLARLDAMMAEWNGRGIRLGYPIASDPSMIDANTDSGIPDVAYEAVITNLAIRLAPSYGKTVSSDTRIAATRGMNTMFAISARPKSAQLGVMPAGAGAKSSSPFIDAQEGDAVQRPDDSASFE